MIYIKLILFNQIMSTKENIQHESSRNLLKEDKL